MIRIFNHYIPAPILVLILVESAVLLASIFIGASIRFGHFEWPFFASVDGLTSKALVFGVLMLMTMTTLGLYQRDFLGGLRGVFVRLCASFVLGFAIMSLMFYLVPDLYLGRGAFGLSFGIAFGGILLVRVLFFQWADLGILRARILVLGTGTRAVNVESIANTSGPGQSSTIVGYLPVKGAQHHVEASRILPVSQGSLLEIVKSYNIDEIVLAVRERRGGGLPMQELLECKLHGVRVTELSTFFERERGQVRLDSVNTSWLVLEEGFNNNSFRDIVKRVFDIGSSLTLLIATLPILLVTALLVKLGSPGPIFYRQERVGRAGATFSICKFRSMRVDAEREGQPKWAASNDDRTTAVGRVIRKLRIDELPQILNVFKGDMSFVGPRPERPFFVKQLTKEIPYYEARHSLKPGITGWAQVRYPYGASVEDAQEKLQYDLYYVKNHSLFLDLMILMDTLQVVLWGKGAR
jgi:sugar transferase (PEP-CTERM system associated)